jgi:hypothetical protein
MPEPPSGKPIDLFFSYSHKDTELREELANHLSVLRRHGVINDWHDRKIGAGREWAGEIDAHLNAAQVIVLLISADFLASDYCYDKEMTRALARHERGEARVIPVIVRPVAWDGTRLAKIQALPRDAKPVSTWGNRDEAWLDVAQGIRSAIRDFTRQASSPAHKRAGIELDVQVGSILETEADVIVLKHAQEFHGADRAVADALVRNGTTRAELRVPKGKHVLVRGAGALAAEYALFLGTVDLFRFRYEQIRAFAVGALDAIAQSRPSVRHMAMTIHGVGYGLDEVEALLAQLAGYLEAIKTGRVPLGLERISIVERDRNRAQRLQTTLDAYLPTITELTQAGRDQSFRNSVSSPGEPNGLVKANAATLVEAGSGAKDRPHVFVSLSAGADSEDLFYFGIQQPVRECGYLCERADEAVLTSEMLARARSRIETPAAMIADLTDADPSVYLKLGYAWGKNVPTILVIRENHHARFDTHGQRYVEYRQIRELSDKITTELTNLHVRHA